MLIQLPEWPQKTLGPMLFKPRARVKQRPRRSFEFTNEYALNAALRLQAATEQIQASGVTGTWAELLFVNRADFNAFANSAAEGSLLAGLNEQPVIRAFFWDMTQAFGRTILIEAQGVLSTTATPTIIFQLRLGTTSGSTFLSGTSIGISPAITTTSGVTNKQWALRLFLTCNTPGIGTGNTTMSGAGWVECPGGFASPFKYSLEPTTPDTATWTSTIDNSVTQYMNLSTTWSAASPSNTITCKQLLVFGLN